MTQKKSNRNKIISSLGKLKRIILEGRAPHKILDHLKKLIFTKLNLAEDRIATMEGKWRSFDRHRAANYDTFKLLTYYIDKEFTVEQKKWFIEKQFYRALGYFPQLDNPRSFNEKTQWYKLNYRDPLMTDLIDKYRFKEKVSELIAPQYVVPLLGVWDRGADIDFDSLPKEFALKSNWGSGSRHVILVKDKDALDLDQVRYKTSNWMQPWENVYYHTFDWGYKDIKPKIIAEKLIKNKLLEYKFFCFNGEPKYFYVAEDSSPGSRNSHTYFDMDWNRLPFVRHAKPTDKHLERPANFDEMVQLSRTLSKKFPHVRVDLCQTETGLIVEELTFYVGSGTGRFTPREWDFKFGEAFDLPASNLHEYEKHLEQD